MSDPMKPPGIYIGDGVYVWIEHGQIVLTTNNGVAETNRIYLEQEVYDALVEYVERAYE